MEYLKYERYGGNEDLYRRYEERRSEEASRVKIVMKGTYKGRQFMIGASRIGYPVAYVEVLPKDNFIMNERKELRANLLTCVDGGSNYYGGAYWDRSDSRKYIGWEYCSFGDYTGHHNPICGYNDNGHKWTVAEILLQIADAISEIEYENYININFRYAPD